MLVRSEKWEFNVSSIAFLGYIVVKGQLKLDTAKIKAMLDWPKPDNGKQLQKVTLPIFTGG